MRLIEEGCRAIIINSAAANSGEVIVGMFIGTVTGFVGLNRWAVNKPMRNSLDRGVCYHCEESQLLRIDGHDTSQDVADSQSLPKFSVMS